MKLETTKSFMLIVLIGISLLLTYGLWSYQPNYETLNDPQLLNEVDIGGKVEAKKDLITPSKMIFHAKDHYYGFSDPKKQQQFFKDMQSWTMYNLDISAADGRAAKTYEVEVVFPGAIPMELLNKIFTLNDNEIELPSWSFQRMYYTFDSDKAALKVQFLSENGKQQATAVINDPNHYDQLWTMVFAPGDLSEYTLFNKDIYLPKDRIYLNKWSLTLDRIEPQDFVNALFANPSIVTRPSGGSGGSSDTYYTDTQRQMKVFRDQRMEFISPYTSENDQMDPLSLLENSVKSINDHKGWTEDYYLLDIKANAGKNAIRYQMYTDGYPVYSGSNLSLIEQEWRDQVLTKYERPLFKMSDPINSDQIELPSSEEVVSYLENNGTYQMESIQDIQIGYKLNYMDDDSYTPYVTLEPAWYMNYNGSWIEIKFEDPTQQKGGD